MNIIVAKSAGYCLVLEMPTWHKTAENMVMYMLGDIVHNERVVSDLEKAGVKKHKN